MKRISAAFERLAARRRSGLILYLTAGDPAFEETPDLLREIADAGADLIELGIPWSDPSADGAVIQRAMERALGSGTHSVVKKTLDAVAALRKSSEVPLVLFGYFNPILQRGPAQLTVEAAQVGADGFLVVDLPHEESDELDRFVRAQGLCRIPLLAPTTSVARARFITARGSGFAYYVALTGTTGSAKLDVVAVAARIAELRPALGALPLAVGFGVRTPETAAELARHADAVVVGSALVELCAAQKNAADRRKIAGRFVRELKAAVDSVEKKGD